jgi:hypothetical protein
VNFCQTTCLKNYMGLLSFYTCSFHFDLGLCQYFGGLKEFHRQKGFGNIDFRYLVQRSYIYIYIYILSCMRGYCD